MFRGGRGKGNYGSRDNRPCFYCGNPDHYVSFCRFKIADEGVGRIRKPTYRGGRGRTFRRRDHDNGGARGDNNEGNKINLGYMAAALDNALRATPMPYSAPPAPSSSHDNHFGVQMAQMQFKSQVVQISEKKSDKALIDSGATHHFF